MFNPVSIPEIIVVTVVYNGDKTIEKSIKSVINQTYSNYKYFIIDGNSHDDTISIVSKYKSNLDLFISESDAGIYDAMNKAINLVNNENAFIIFLNADDYLFSSSSLENISIQLKGHDFVYGKVLLFNEQKDQYFPAGREMNFTNLPFGMIQHQATFTRKALFSDLGNFDCSYQIAADFDFAIKVFKEGYKIKYIDEVVSVMKLGESAKKGLSFQ